MSPWVGKISWRRAWQTTPLLLPKNPMDRGAWPRIQAIGLQSQDTTEAT